MARGERRKVKRQQKPCRVYWGSHGCHKVRGHGGEHICSGCGPPWPQVYPELAERDGLQHGGPADVTLNAPMFFGEDVELYQALAMEC